jgi:hypothetical protein
MEAELGEASRLLANLIRERQSLRLRAAESRQHREELVLSPAEIAAAKELWRSAVAVQARLSGQGDAVAEQVVISMLNQMVRLADLVPWWESHAAAVIAETVKFTSGIPAVDSAAAQRAWDDCRSVHYLIGKLGYELDTVTQEELEALTRREAQSEEEWRAAWDRWHAERSA